jgi:flagellar biosynthesis/type III secretory pathway protein FliH
MSRVIRGASSPPAPLEGESQTLRNHDVSALRAQNELDKLIERARDDARAELARGWIALERERQLHDEHQRREIARLAVAVAEKIVRSRIELEPDRVLHMVEGVLDRQRHASGIELRVHSADLERVRHAFPFARVVPDESMMRGGCVLSSTSGSVDGRIETQLERIERALRDDPT